MSRSDKTAFTSVFCYISLEDEALWLSIILLMAAAMYSGSISGMAETDKPKASRTDLRRYFTVFTWQLSALAVRSRFEPSSKRYVVRVDRSSGLFLSLFKRAR